VVKLSGIIKSPVSPLQYSKALFPIDVRLFESWDNYEYAFDTILCASNPEFNKSIIRIFEKNSNKEVWKIGVGQYAKTYLKQLR